MRVQMTPFKWFSGCRKVSDHQKMKEEIWLKAFSEGFSKAWDMAFPLMQEGFGNLKNKVYSDAIQEALEGLESVIEKRLEDISKANVRPTNDLLAKKAQLLKSLSSEKDELKRIQLSHFIEALDWVINANSQNSQS